MKKLIKRIDPSWNLSPDFGSSGFQTTWMFFLQGQIASASQEKLWEENVSSSNFFGQTRMTAAIFKTQNMSKDSDASLGYSTDLDGLQHPKMDLLRDILRHGILRRADPKQLWLKMFQLVSPWINGGKFRGEGKSSHLALCTGGNESQNWLSPPVPLQRTPRCHISPTMGYGWCSLLLSRHYRVEHGGISMALSAFGGVSFQQTAFGNRSLEHIQNWFASPGESSETWLQIGMLKLSVKIGRCEGLKADGLRPK